MSSKHDVTLIDGGMGHELKVCGVVSNGSFLAGVLANEAHPEEVTSVHRDFIRSGCRVITTNSFVAVPPRMGEGAHHCHGDGEEATDRATRLILAAVRCAGDAVASVGGGVGGGVRIAGCVPPLTDYYVSSRVPEDWVNDLVPTYEIIVSALLSSRGVDVLLAETLSTIREGLAVASRRRCLDTSVVVGGNNASIPDEQQSQSLWLLFTVRDDRPGRLRSGESLEDAIDAVCSSSADEGCVNLDAIGVNCGADFGVGGREGGPRGRFVATETAQGLGLRQRLSVDHFGVASILRGRG